MTVRSIRDGRRDEGGFSLVEIAVAVSVLLMALLGLAFAMVSAWRLERSAAERKLAIQWAASQMETIRALGLGGCMADPPAGYLIPPTWTNAGLMGVNKDADSDGDPEVAARFYYSNPNQAPYTSPFGHVVPLYDPLLQGLRPQAATSIVGTVIFTDPDGTTGVVEGDGYWVTIWVRWTGVQGNQEVKMSTLIVP
ncbi:MAG TPA: hypothetical protein VFS92_00040 [Planctomycetota bacterium]|nr:hypothetical protein [Planctomycetota bacterium]